MYDTDKQSCHKYYLDSWYALHIRKETVWIKTRIKP